jgi:hypothetical protein
MQTDKEYSTGIFKRFSSRETFYFDKPGQQRDLFSSAIFAVEIFFLFFLL